MEKVTRKTESGDEVAVLVAPGFGAGWYTWNNHVIGSEQLLFDRVIVNSVLNKEDSTDWILDITNRVDEIFGKDVYICLMGIDDLEVAWIPVGTRFIVREYDGFESIETEDEINWINA